MRFRHRKVAAARRGDARFLGRPSPIRGDQSSRKMARATRFFPKFARFGANLRGAEVETLKCRARRRLAWRQTLSNCEMARWRRAVRRQFQATNAPKARVETNSSPRENRKPDAFARAPAARDALPPRAKVARDATRRAAAIAPLPKQSQFSFSPKKWASSAPHSA